MATHSSILAWRIPRDGGAWWVTVHGVTKSWAQLSDQAHTHTYTHLHTHTHIYIYIYIYSFSDSFPLQVITRYWAISLFSIAVPCWLYILYIIVQFSSVAQSCSTLWDPMNHSTAVLSVHHQLPEFTQTRVHSVGDAIQPSHPVWSPSPPAPNPSQHQGLFRWVSSSHQVAKVLEFQLQHQFFQWIYNIMFLLILNS